jgi:hypothetical protein
MNIPLILALGAAMALPQGAPSESPINSDALGRVEAMLAYCAKADPPSATRYQERGSVFVRSHSAKEVEAARNSDEYRSAFDWSNVELDKVSPGEAVKNCNAFLEGK